LAWSIRSRAVESSGWLPYLIAAGVAVAVAGLGVWATDLSPWYFKLKKPPWQPPDWVFGPAWTTIFALAAISAGLAWNQALDGESRGWIVGLFAVNGLLNILWSVLFFSLRRPDWALVEVVPLWLSVLALIVALAPVSALASWLLVPYLVWVAFAAYLNLAIFRLNAPFSGHRRS
jgi:tryptophan-rich sensory protein